MAARWVPLLLNDADSLATATSGRQEEAAGRWGARDNGRSARRRRCWVGRAERVAHRRREPGERRGAEMMPSAECKQRVWGLSAGLRGRQQCSLVTPDSHA